MSSRSNSKEVVMSYLKALNDEDFKSARTFVSDNMSFLGPLASVEGAEVYFKDMERMRLKYNIKKVFEDGEMSASFMISVLGLQPCLVVDGINWRTGR